MILEQNCPEAQVQWKICLTQGHISFHSLGLQKYRLNLKITLYIKENHSFRSNYRPQHTSPQKTALENLSHICFLYSFHLLCLFFISFIIYYLYIYFAFAWSLSAIMLDSKSQTENMWSLIVDRSTKCLHMGRLDWCPQM